MKNLYEALHPKQKRFYTEERKKFICKKRLPVLLRDEKKYQDDVEGEYEVEHIAMTILLVNSGKYSPSMLPKTLEYRDASIDRLFWAMQRVVDCARIIQR